MGSAKLTLDAELIDLLMGTDTPTVCNAIELAQGKRGFDAFTRGRYVAMHASPRVAMGFARTAKIAAASPPDRDPDATKKIRMEYYEYMSGGGRPAIAVIEDTDPEPVGAYWGELNTTVHRGFGLSGTLTNGMMRDFGCCPEDYQVIGGGISPSHAFVHVVEVGGAVRVFGMGVSEGDFVHADRNGACVIPPDILPEIGKWIAKTVSLEEIVLGPAGRDGFDFDAFRKAWGEFEKKRV